MADEIIMIARRGKINLWAAGFSAAAHVVLLGGFAAVHLGASAEPVSASLGAVSMQTVKRTIHAPLVTPKPQVKSEIPSPPEPQPVAVPSEKPQVVQLSPEPLISAEPVQSVSPAIPEPSEAEFFGQDTIARTLCFVVDCSGSMYGRLELVQQQLKDCIASLKESQSFDLIFFMDGNTLLEMGDGRVVPANGSSKSRAFDMIDHIRFKGQTNARQALERAMQIRDARHRPVQLVYFLTDGFDLQISSPSVFCGDIEQMRKDHAPSMKINTIGLWASEQDQKMLQLIAAGSGGQFISVEAKIDNL